MAWYEVGIASNVLTATQNRAAAVALSCPGGNQQCLGGSVAYASKTPVHGIVAMLASRLINLVLWASRTVNRILAEGGRGSTLEMIDVGGEVLLAWTSPELPEGYRRVTEIHEVRRLLRVRGPLAVEDQPGSRTEGQDRGSDGPRRRDRELA